MKKVLSLVISCLIIIGCIPVCAKETEQNYSDFIVVENEDDVTITKVTQSNLVNVTIPGEINGKKVKLSSRLFEGMESLESVIIEEGVVEIPENAFHKCINLKTVKLPNTLEIIDEWAFRESGLNEIDLPNRVISIGNSAFNGTKITNVRIPEKVTILSNYTFSGCEQLTFVDLNNVEVVRQGAFSECTKLERVVHSGNLIELESFAFENCPALNEIDVKNVKAFGSRVFYGNEKIEYMNLQSVEEAVMVKDDYIQGDENPYFVGEWYIKGGGISSPLSFSSFSGMMALKTVRVNLANFKTKGIGVLFFRMPQLDTIIYENFSPEVTGKWLCHEYDLTKPRNANLVLYGNEDVKAYAESIGVPFKELIDVNLNGERIRMDDCLPYIKNDRTLVPMRVIFEALGAEVSWDDATKTAIGVKDGVEVKITIGENVLYKNGEAIELDAPAEITNDRTMVPVRAISEAFSYIVEWDNETKTVNILDPYKRKYYKYDEKGQVVSISSNLWTSDVVFYFYLYDESGRVIRVWERPMIKNSDRLFEYTYNEKGQVIAKGTCKDWWMDVLRGAPIDKEVTFTEVEKYFYDEEGRLNYAEYPSGGRRYYIYDEEGKLIREENEKGEVVKKYVYLEEGRINYTESY